MTDFLSDLRSLRIPASMGAELKALHKVWDEMKVKTHRVQKAIQQLQAQQEALAAKFQEESKDLVARATGAQEALICKLESMLGQTFNRQDCRIDLSYYDTDGAAYFNYPAETVTEFDHSGGAAN